MTRARWFAGRHDVKGILHVHTHEGRYVERLVAMLVDGALIRAHDRNQVKWRWPNVLFTSYSSAIREPS